jgi:hypothetical protein
MVRQEGWELKLSGYLRESKDKPFVWGVNDCVLFGVKAVELITGENHYEQYLGYTDEHGAKEIINEAGSLEKLISRHFGKPHRNILLAKRGDLAMLKSPSKTIAIVDDSGRFVCGVSESGYARVPLSNAWCIWSY